MECILTVRSEVKNIFGAPEYAAAHVPGLWQAVDIESEWFADLKQNFPKINEANWKDRIFVGAQPQQQFADQNEMLQPEQCGRHLKTSEKPLRQ